MSEGKKEILTNGDLVVIVHSNEIPELQMACQTGCLTCHSLLGTAISEEHESMIVGQLVT